MTRSTAPVTSNPLGGNEVSGVVVGPVVQADTIHGDIQINYARPRIVPRQLPGATPHFVGRARELAILNAQLAHTGGAVAITAVGGTAGIGKTTLVIHWARRHLDRFPDGQLYVNLRGFHPSGTPMPVAEAIRVFLDAFQIPEEEIPIGLETQAALYRSLVEGKQMLIVLDNARDANLVRPLLPGSPTCLVVVTSRRQLAGLVAREHARHISLEALATGEAFELLTKFLGEERVHTDTKAVARLIERCAGLPIALTIAAARTVTNPHIPLGVLAKELADLSTGDGDETDIRMVFSWSYVALPRDTARLFRLLGLHPGPDFSGRAAASLAGLPTAQVGTLLAALTQANLLDQHGPDRYRFHDLLRAYAHERAVDEEPEPQRRAAIHRVLDHYLHTSLSADRHLSPGRDPIPVNAPQAEVILVDVSSHDKATAWFVAEHTTLLAVIDLAADAGFDTHAWQLPWSLFTFQNRHGYWHEYATAQRIALAAADHLGDRGAQAETHHLLGWVLQQQGRHADALDHVQTTLALFLELDDPAGQAHAHYTLSWLHEREMRYSEALTHAQDALVLYLAVGHQAGEAQALNTIGWDSANLGEYQQALTHCRQALRLHRERGDGYGEALALNCLGYSHHHLGRHAEAIAYYEQAIVLLRDVGDRYEEAATIARLGDTHLALGDVPTARNAWQQGLVILDRLGHPLAERVRAKFSELDRSSE